MSTKTLIITLAFLATLLTGTDLAANKAEITSLTNTTHTTEIA